MRINTNISSLKAANRMAGTQRAKAKNLERLSSGLRINKAADDAAGLAISEKMRGQIRGMGQAMKNANDGQSMISTAEGAMGQIGDIVQRMRELTVQAANGTNNTDERNKIKDELDGLHSEIDRIANSTKFNDKQLINGGGASLSSANIEGAASIDSIEVQGDLSGAGKLILTAGAADGKVTAELQDGAGVSLATQMVDVGSDTYNGTINFDKLGVKVKTNGGGLNADFGAGVTDTVAATGGTMTSNIQIGANASETISIAIDNVTTASLGLTAADLDIATGVTATDDATINTLLNKLDDALSGVSSSRAKLGTGSNRLDFAMANLQSSFENLTEAESRIRDVDMAQEMVDFTKNNILSQAGNAMLAQSNQMPSQILSLLQM